MVESSASPLPRLCVPYERWGWEYVDPGAPQPSPLLYQQPLLFEPAPPPAQPGKQRSTGKRVALFAVIAFFTLPMIAVNAVFLLFTAGIAAALFLPGIVASNKAANITRTWHAQVARARQDYERQLADWRDAIAAHDVSEWRRLATVDLWRPLALRSSTDRVDVVGGVPEGWRQMLVTFGATVVARSARLMVLDLTQERVADGLAKMANGTWKVQELQLPRDGHRLNLLSGLTPDEAAEILAEAAETMRGTPDPALRATDADLLRAVAHQLQGSVTTTRLAAGVRVLQRTYDGGDLTPEEITRLTRQIDMIGSNDRTQDQLRFLRVALELLTSPAVQQEAPEAILDLWRDSMVTVIATDSAHATKKDFTDRALFHSLLQRLRDPQLAVAGQVLVVAGADHLGATALEAMAKHARARGVRLVYFFEHLRDSAQRLVGSGQSAAMIMRLGHPAEAAAAAEYVGRCYSFKIAQYTYQVGITGTAGGGDSWGDTTSQTWGQSSSESASQSFQRSTNWSKARSVTNGTTNQRVYEFDVEPQSIQTLPVTMFVLVEGDGQRRRAAVADANPAIATFARVASHPEPAPRQLM